MSGLVWLASYPKSGNTWFRMLISNLGAEGEIPAGINKPTERTPIAAARRPFDEVTAIDSLLIGPDDADRLRPAVYRTIACGDYVDPMWPRPRHPAQAPRIMKVHDAYGPTPDGEPLLAAAQAAILIVRDPRAIAPSLANHLGCTLDRAIDSLGSAATLFGARDRGFSPQLRQRLLSWSDHVESWLDQRDVPVHLVRYEDLRVDTAAFFRDAMRFAGRDISAAEAERAAKLADFRELQEQERAQGFRERPRSSRVFFRRGEAQAWRDELSSAQIARIEAAHGRVMRRLGYALSNAVASRHPVTAPGGDIGRRWKG
jgi:hypothetical protein